MVCAPLGVWGYYVFPLGPTFSFAPLNSGTSNVDPPLRKSLKWFAFNEFGSIKLY